ncbi:MAG: TIGR02996 domain-containing protein [Kofleriaceae bacterium]
MTDAATLLDSIKEDQRWFCMLAGNERSIAIAFEGRRFWIWRDGNRDPKEAFGRDFEHAKEQVAELVHAAIAAGMEHDRGARDPGVKPELVFASNPALEAACRAAPDDPAPWSVYADWLMQQGDPRGETAALKRAGRSMPIDAFIDETAVQITSWRHGFPSSATIKTEYGALVLPKLTQTFLASPMATFVDALRFGLAGFESNNDWEPTLEAVRSSAVADHIRSVKLDDFDSGDCEMSWVPTGNLAKLWQLPNLREVVISGGQSGELGTIVAPKLETFIRISGGLQQNELQSIMSAHWPELRHLEIWFGSVRYNAEGTAAHLAPILSGAGTPKLAHLGIVNCELVLAALEALIASPLLKRLRTLDLSHGVMSTDECRLVVENADAFRHLERIDVSDNFLTYSELQQLERVLTNVVTTGQRDVEDYGRFAALGE